MWGLHGAREVIRAGDCHEGKERGLLLVGLLVEDNCLLLHMFSIVVCCGVAVSYTHLTLPTMAVV